MARVDHEILSEFIGESKSLIEEGGEILDSIEGDQKQYLRLLEYANRVDRIMGAARSLATMVGPDHPLHLVGDATGLCKAVATRGASLSGRNPQVFDVTVAFLLDVNEFVGTLLLRLNEPLSSLKSQMQETFLERLRWLSDLYRQAPEEKKGTGPMDQAEIDALLKKLGV